MISRHNDGSSIVLPDINWPEGGGAIGYGEAFQLDAATGSAQFEFPIKRPQARTLTPSLTLKYNSSNGNGLFGYGFNVGFPAISRRTNLGTPRYNGDDQFVTSTGDILVPRYKRKADKWVLEKTKNIINEASYNVVYFRRRIENEKLVSISHWIHPETQTSFWQITDNNNITSIYGQDANARIADPSDPSRIFQWLLCEQRDALGNSARYDYETDTNTKGSSASLYPKSISYGNYPASSPRSGNTDEAYAFIVTFDYSSGKFDVFERPDLFSTFRPGFELITTRLCHKITVAHNFPTELGEAPLVVQENCFTYAEQAGLSLLQSIVTTGLRTLSDGTVAKKQMPPVTFGYNPWEPAAASFKPFADSGSHKIPSPVDGVRLRFVDLYGDGLPGILEEHTAGSTSYYWSPLGMAAYKAPAPLPQAPISALSAPAKAALMDLSGVGKRDSVLLASGQSGFYGNNNDGSWQPFQAFEGAPLELADPSSTFVDLTGNGLADFLNTDTQNWYFNEAQGRKGFSRPITQMPPAGTATYSTVSEASFLGFADIYGDGLSHLVEVSSGLIRVWPNLGYGRFAPPRDIPGLPTFTQDVTTARIVFGNLTGAGGSDIIIVYSDHIDIYQNHYGQRFSLLRSVPLPANYASNATAQAVDLFGKGVDQFIISLATGAIRHAYLDPSNGKLPYLLARIANGGGTITNIEYRSSTDYFLKDLESGDPWITKLPFPVSVVSKITQKDLISRTSLTRVTQYRDGYFDPLDRQFAGFAYSQIQDYHTVDDQTWHFPCFDPVSYQGAFESDVVDPGVKPLMTRSWYYVGAYLKTGALRTHMLDNSYLQQGVEFVLPAPVISNDIINADAETRCLAYKALAGQQAAEQAHGISVDGKPNPVPYHITQNGYRVQLVQPAIDANPAVVIVNEIQSATINYEERSDDAQTFHTINTAFDPFGNVVQTLEIGYARPHGDSKTILPGQAKAAIRMHAKGLINHIAGRYDNGSGGTTVPLKKIDGKDFHLIGLEFEQQTFELYGFDQPGPFYSYDDGLTIATDALVNVIPFGVPFSGEMIQARLFSWRQQYFWFENLSAIAPLQETGDQSLPAQKQNAVLSNEFFTEQYGDLISATELQQRTGYYSHDDYWWASTYTISYFPVDGYYRAKSYTDPFGAEVVLGYDSYYLKMIRKTDPLGKSVSCCYDYQALEAKEIIDENQIKSEFGFNGLGEVCVSTIFGTENGVSVGDEPLANYNLIVPASAAEVLADPGKYLQNAESFFYYDLEAWSSDAQMPPFSIALERRTFVHPPPHASYDPNDIGIKIHYFDGSGRDLATVELVSGLPPFTLFDTPVLQITSHNQVDGVLSQTQWIISNQQRYDDRGNPVIRFQPYFTDVPALEERPNTPFWSISYDPLYREVETLTPKGFITRSVYSSWSDIRFDEDDSVTSSPFYNENINNPDLPPTEKKALEMAALFENTPVITERDVLGRNIQEIQTYASGTTKTQGLVKGQGIPSPTKGKTLLKSYSWYDAQDKVYAFSDSRFYNENDPASPSYYNFFVLYDMLGRPAVQKSADAGNQALKKFTDGTPWIRLYDAFNNITDEWDRRLYHHVIQFNILRLPTETRIKGNGIDIVAEIIIYGDDVNSNTVNRIISHKDPAGILDTPLYSLHGDPTSFSRRYVENFKEQPDWNRSPKMETTTWYWQEVQNAVGERIYYQAPNDAIVLTSYTYSGWPFKQVLSGNEETDVNVIEIGSFSTSGRPALVTMQNGVSVRQTFDQETLRLRSITAVNSDGTMLQDISYTYDPVGNVTALVNGVPLGAYQGEAENSQPVTNDYSYSSIYTLLFASGRRQDIYAGKTADETVTPIEAYERIYLYDASGNLVSITDKGGSPYSYDYVVSEFANHSVTKTMAKESPPDSFFDADGLMTRIPNGTGLIFDPFARLSQSTQAAGTSFYQYTSTGKRVRKSRVDARNETVSQTYYMDAFISQNGNIEGSSTPVTLNIALDDILFAEANYEKIQQKINGRDNTIPTPKLTYQLSDRIKSVSLQLDENGTPVNVQEFYPYGETAIYISPADNPVSQKRYQFTGQELDISSGLYSFEKRYYCPALSHWISPDPAGTRDGPNLFAYVNGNPVSTIDPTGQNGEDGDSAPTPKVTLIGMLKRSNSYGVSANALGEVLTGNIHYPPSVLFDKSLIKTAWSLKFSSLAGFGSLFGGITGSAYYGLDIYKNNANIYNTTSLLGNLLFSWEGIKIYKSMLLTSNQAFHLAHARIGLIGFYADALKIPYAVKKQDWSSVSLYTGLAAGNLRSAVSETTAENFYRKAIQSFVTPYEMLSISKTYPVSSVVRSVLPKTLARVPGYGIIAATLIQYHVIKKITEKKY